MSSFTSASQHYSDYSDMPMVVHPDHIDEFSEVLYGEVEDYSEVSTALELAGKDYAQMVDNGVPIYEARMVLPNAATVNILWTVNARSLVNFFEQRLCLRNVDEMQMVAVKILEQVKEWWPELAECVGPQCFTKGVCNQGKMTCGEEYEPS